MIDAIVVNKLTHEIDQVLQGPEELIDVQEIKSHQFLVKHLKANQQEFYYKDGQLREYTPGEKARRLSKPNSSVTWDPVQGNWIDARPAEEIVQEISPQVDDARRTKEQRGFVAEIGSNKFKVQTDPVSLSRLDAIISGALCENALGYSSVINFKDADNRNIPLTTQDVLELGVQLKAFLSDVHNRTVHLKEQLRRTEDPNEMIMLCARIFE